MTIIAKVGFTGSIANMQTEKFVLTFEQMQTLNSVPIALVTPPTATSIVVVFGVYQMVKAGSAPFSNPLHLSLAVDATASCYSGIVGPDFDGSVSIANFYDYVSNALSLPGEDFFSLGGIGTPLFLVGASDETGGDDTVLTLIINYQIVDTAGSV